MAGSWGLAGSRMTWHPAPRRLAPSCHCESTGCEPRVTCLRSWTTSPPPHPTPPQKAVGDASCQSCLSGWLQRPSWAQRSLLVSLFLGPESSSRRCAQPLSQAWTASHALAWRATCRREARQRLDESGAKLVLQHRHIILRTASGLHKSSGATCLPWHPPATCQTGDLSTCGLKLCSEF